VGRARASIELPAQVSAAEALWYDVTRWPAFVDGFGHVAKLEGDWPRAGARLVWDSVQAGRGRVVERVVHYEVRAGQTVEVEDPRITGTQTVTFTPSGDGVSRLDLELRYALKDSTPVTPLVDLLFVRRAFNDALKRTVSRFGRELRAEAEFH
jgi:Polyketide cyclase / dehydrase and lipid transport